MDLAPEKKIQLRAAVHSAIESGMAHGVPDESPPLPPTRERINQAAYWVMGEFEKALLHHNQSAVARQGRLEEQVRRLEEENERLRTQEAIAERDARIRDLQSHLDAAREHLTAALTTTKTPVLSGDRGRDSGPTLTEVRTVHKRAQAAISLIDGLGDTANPRHDPDRVDPDHILIRAALSQTVALLAPWKRTGRTAR